MDPLDSLKEIKLACLNELKNYVSTGVDEGWRNYKVVKKEAQNERVGNLWDEESLDWIYCNFKHCKENCSVCSAPMIFKIPRIYQRLKFSNSDESTPKSRYLSRIREYFPPCVDFKCSSCGVECGAVPCEDYGMVDAIIRLRSQRRRIKALVAEYQRHKQSKYWFYRLDLDDIYTLSNLVHKFEHKYW